MTVAQHWYAARWSRVSAALLALLLAACGRTTPAPAKYAGSAACAGCHASIARTYRQTGMARSFSAVRAMAPVKPYEHRLSGRTYSVVERGGRFFQRREPGPFEKEIHYVMGSGNHARTFLHRTAQGRLLELPLAWYAENGGTWAMNPGYDRPDHPGFRRAISDDCMFCHNSYPAVDRRPGADPVFPAQLPEGIGCERCHGPGSRHIEAASKGRPKAELRSLIYNPPAERHTELCMQCHLESTSRPLPYAITRFDRSPYGYNPREPLSAHAVFFDFAPGHAPDDHFEIAHAAYRLRKSKCNVTCTTCHNPHQTRSATSINAVCGTCHQQAHSNTRPDCTGCHMPKRRTDDVVHVSMTDHFIRRQPPRDLLAPKSEQHGPPYRGEVVLLHPSRLPDDLYPATAQVYSGANLAAGIPRLRDAIQKHRPREPQFYHQLAEAYYRTGDDSAAVEWFRAALERDPAYLPAIRNLGATLTRMGRYAEAASVLRQAPADPAALNNLGEALLESGDVTAAAQALQGALAIDPEMPEALNNLGRAHSRSGNPAAAAADWREAVRVQPDFALAHSNLANLLHASGDWNQARHHFEQAVKDKTSAVARFNYGTALAERGAIDEAEQHLREAVRIDPLLAPAHLNLGNIEAMRGRRAEAAAHFRAASRNPALRAGAEESLRRLEATP